MKVFALTAVMLLSPTDARPVWEQFDRLLCEARKTSLCTADDCRSTPPKASFLIDFQAGTAKAAAAEDSVKIVHRYYVEPLGTLIAAKSSMTTEENDLFSLQAPMIGPDGYPVISAVRVTAYDDKTLTMWLECKPE